MIQNYKFQSTGLGLYIQDLCEWLYGDYLHKDIKVESEYDI